MARFWCFLAVLLMLTAFSSAQFMYPYAGISPSAYPTVYGPTYNYPRYGYSYGAPDIIYKNAKFTKFVGQKEE
ncbi:unnamed protein product [Caenorhabditis auriculariae]|uniref:Uncharacterized protein n=1 Tax=Caenorhabditis auriculariae TaxID=2777116 RepID=A0A8S1HKR9_9PELO|nr:unnamed protein product [Caenorhabditis auriculariae]